MTTYVLATDSVDASARICDYLQDRLTTDDTVHAINSKRGGDETTAEAIRLGEDALNVVSSRLGAAVTVETHQFVRGNDPAADVLECAEEVEADEVLIAVRHRTPAGKALFGSVAQTILLEAERPVVSIPRE
ncbi:universal stress protein [Haloparvum sedimenti]|uniref:universal stress protein n=1 Tax=Haloparvum sedimenti TaxID=1678448 RepID=UPI00071E7EB4|nr:universal stress protein [Haloparvum sedimenti]